MLRRAAIAGIALIGVVVAIAMLRGATQRPAPDGTAPAATATTTREVESEREDEREREVESEREDEREDEVEREDERERETPEQRTLSRMAAIRQDVHVLEMQRLDARDRGDHDTEARLDAEIAAARAEHDRLRDTLTEPEGI